MIIGNGLVATAFRHYDQEPDTVIIAAGVSDSTTSNPIAFAREAALIREVLQHNRDKTIVYISTCSIYDETMKSSAYVMHKIEMEALVQQSGAPYNIFRMTNLVSKTNKATTFFHQLTTHIQSGTSFDLWMNARRNIIDCADAVKACNHILSHGLYRNTVTNIAHPHNYPVLQIAEWIGAHFGKTPVYRTISKGGEPVIDTTNIQPLFAELGIIFGDRYIPQILEKYYPLS